jgi:hypothetical protein
MSNDLKQPQTSSKPNIDWAKVVEIIISILTLGLSHLRKHNNQTGK